MHFTRLRLESWKNFKAVDVELAERVFVIGANASGKSNFLEVFRFLHDLTTEGGGLAKAVSLREGMSKVRSLHATINSAVVIEAEIQEGRNTWTYELEFDTPSGRRNEVHIKKEVVRHNKETLEERPNEDDRQDPERLRQTSIEQVAANRNFRPLAEFFRSIRFMNLVPQLVREGQSSPGVFPGGDPLGRDLLDQIRTCPKGRRTQSLKRIDTVLRKVVPGYKNLRFEEDDRGQPHLAVAFKHWRSQDAKQRESQFSDGTLRLIGMLWAMQERGGPLLLEEPEWSLHTGILERLAGFIAKVMRENGGRQVFITTHSERLLSDHGIAPEELLLILPAKKGGSEIHPAARSSIIEKTMGKQGLSASEAALPLTRLETMPLFGSAV
jgi:predicted ATPase